MNESCQEDLRQRNGPQHRGVFQPPTRQTIEWTVDPFWETERPTPVQTEQNDRPGPKNGRFETDQDPSILEVPAKNCARYVKVKSVQDVKMEQAPRIPVEEPTDLILDQAVREIEKKFSTDLQLLMP